MQKDTAAASMVTKTPRNIDKAAEHRHQGMEGRKRAEDRCDGLEQQLEELRRAMGDLQARNAEQAKDLTAAEVRLEQAEEAQAEQAEVISDLDMAARTRQRGHGCKNEAARTWMQE